MLHCRKTREHSVQLSSLGVSMHPVSPGPLHSLRVINFPAPLWRDPSTIPIRLCIHYTRIVNSIITKKILVTQLCTYRPCHFQTPLTLWVIDQSPFSIVTILKDIGMKFTNLSIEALYICTVKSLSTEITYDHTLLSSASSGNDWQQQHFNDYCTVNSHDGHSVSLFYTALFVTA